MNAVLYQELVVISKMIFPELTEEERDYYFWNYTGWPCFWNGDPRMCLGNSLLKLRETFDAGKRPCMFCNEPVPKEGDLACDVCEAHLKAVGT